MTAYELVDAFNSTSNSTLSFVLAYISATSAFVVIAHIASNELPAYIARLATAIYTFVAVFLIGATERSLRLLVSIREQMPGVVDWHLAVVEPRWFLPSFSVAALVVMCALYAASVWYFVYLRKKR